MKRLYVARHGRVDYSGDYNRQLSLEGIQDAHSIAEQLRRDGFTPAGIIMSSVAPRALDTAQIVRQDLRVPTLVSSSFVTRAGEYPQLIRDLWDFIGTILTACEVDHAVQDVAVITHLPLMGAIAGDQQLQHGHAYNVPEGWRNPLYVEYSESLPPHPEP